MNFPDCIAKEHADEFGEITCWQVEVTPPPTRLVVRSWRMEDGREKYPWSYSVLVSNLDTESVTVQEAYEETELHYLHARCSFYRDAIVEKREFDPAFIHRSIVLRLPLAKEVSDLAAAQASFKDFLKKHGAKEAVLTADVGADLLKQIEAALQPAQRVRVSSNDKKTTLEYTVALDAEKFSLVCRMERVAGRKKIPLWELPLGAWKFRKALTPEVETDTFELLSTDVTLNDLRRIAPDETVFMAQLYAVEHLDTREHFNSAHPGTYRMWYVDVLFPDEATAKKFLAVCAEVIPQLRERLHACQRITPPI
jgi:hypothetical protein